MIFMLWFLTSQLSPKEEYQRFPEFPCLKGSRKSRLSQIDRKSGPGSNLCEEMKGKDELGTCDNSRQYNETKFRIDHRRPKLSRNNRKNHLQRDKKNSDAYYRETVLLHHCATRETGLEVTSIFRHKKTQEQRRNKARCPEESKEYGVTDSWENLVP